MIVGVPKIGKKNSHKCEQFKYNKVHEIITCVKFNVLAISGKHLDQSYQSYNISDK